MSCKTAMQIHVVLSSDQCVLCNWVINHQYSDLPLIYFSCLKIKDGHRSTKLCNPMSYWPSSFKTIFYTLPFWFNNKELIMHWIPRITAQNISLKNKHLSCITQYSSIFLMLFTGSFVFLYPSLPMNLWHVSNMLLLTKIYTSSVLL